MIVRGELDRVTAVPLATALTADVAIGVAVLPVDWTVEFVATGGLLSLNGVTLAYTSADEDAASVTLAATLAAAAVAGDPVLALSEAGEPQVTLQAWVVFTDGVEPVPYGIDTSMQGRLTEATPPGTAVEVDDETGLVVQRTDIPTGLDLSDAFNMPDPPFVATEPPPESPAIKVTGNAAGLLVWADPILPSTFLDYLVDGVAVAVDQRTTVLQLATIDAVGTPMDLTGATSYTVTSQAHNSAGDEGGSNPSPSTGVTAAPNPGMTAEMVTAILVAGFILAGEISVANMVWNQTGFIITHPDGRQTILRADGTGNQFVGQAILDATTILGSLTILGPDNFLNGLLTLGTGVGNPTSLAGVTGGTYDSATFTTSGSADPDVKRRGLFWTGTQWLVASDVAFLAHATHFDTAGANTFGGAFVPNGFAPLGGVVKVGTSFYVLGQDGNRSNNWYVYIFNSSWVKTSEWTLGAPSDSNTIGTDGTDVLIGRRTSAGSLIVYHFSTAGAVLSSRTCGTWAGASLTGVHERAVDTGTVRYVVASSGFNARVFNTSTGARITGEEWPASYGLGLGHDGTNWFTHDGTKIWKYTNLIGDVAVKFAWVDSDAGGAGTAETMPCPATIITPWKRSKWTFSLPSPPPDDGTTDGANTASIYAAYPAAGTMVRQTALAEGVYSATYSTLLTSGTAPQVTNGFAARVGAIGEIAAASGGFRVDGQSAGDWPGKLTVSGTIASGAATTTNASGYCTLTVAPGFTPTQYECHVNNSQYLVKVDMANSTATSIRVYFRNATVAGAPVLNTVNVGDIRWVAFP